MFTGIKDAKCFDPSESFCRDEALTPLVSGALKHYKDDPLKATEYKISYLRSLFQTKVAEWLWRTICASDAGSKPACFYDYPVNELKVHQQGRPLLQGHPA